MIPFTVMQVLISSGLAMDGIQFSEETVAIPSL